MQRRAFLRQSGYLALLASGLYAASESRRYTACVIGHTGRGNYGHGLDLIFQDQSQIEVVGVADADGAGREKAKARINAARAYAHYQEMLEKERPLLVSVAPRWTEEHHAMVQAALEVGAHVFCEKPFTRTLAEADSLLSLAQRSGRKISVAHQGRLAPATLLLKQRIDAGLLGDLLEIRVHGKQDRRAGGEDMLVLGTHQFDLVRFFAGDPLWCSARVLQNGREIEISDARSATEGIGPVAGDEIEAMFALRRGVNVHYTSRARNAGTAGAWGMEFVGSKGRARLLNDIRTDVIVLNSKPVSARGGTSEWVPLEPRPDEAASYNAQNAIVPNRWLVDDWLAAIAEEREPICSGHAAMKSLEMIHAVWAAALSRGRVQFPLSNRDHPLVLRQV